MATDVSRLRKRERQVNKPLHPRRRVIALRAAPNVRERAGQGVLGQPVTTPILLRNVLLLRQQRIDKAATWRSAGVRNQLLVTFRRRRVALLENYVPGTDETIRL